MLRSVGQRPGSQALPPPRWLSDVWLPEQLLQGERRSSAAMVGGAAVGVRLPVAAASPGGRPGSWKRFSNMALQPTAWNLSIAPCASVNLALYHRIACRTGHLSLQRPHDQLGFAMDGRSRGHACRQFARRCAGWSQLNNLALPQFAATTDQEFVRLAAALVDQGAELAELRTGLRTRLARSPLTDGATFCAMSNTPTGILPGPSWTCGRDAG